MPGEPWRDATRGLPGRAASTWSHTASASKFTAVSWPWRLAARCARTRSHAPSRQRVPSAPQGIRVVASNAA